MVIASPDEFHVRQLGEAIEAGVHVLIEKPLATNFNDLIRVQNLLMEAEEKKLVVTSCHPRRFDPPFVWLKAETARFVSELGPVIGFDFDFSYHHPSAEWKKDRSLLLDHANHEIDLVNFLYGHTKTIATKITDRYDRYGVVGFRTDGISFRFRGTRKLESRKFLEFARIRHERGEVEFDTEHGEASWENHETGEYGVLECGATDYPLRFAGVMKNFVEAIRGETPNYLTTNDLLTNTAFGIDLVEHGVFPAP